MLIDAGSSDDIVSQIRVWQERQVQRASAAPVTLLELTRTRNFGKRGGDVVWPRSRSRGLCGSGADRFRSDDVAGVTEIPDEPVKTAPRDGSCQGVIAAVDEP